MKHARPPAIAAALMLTACHGEPAGLLQASEPPATAGPARGIDLAIDASDILNELKGSRVDFVVRYYRHPESRWPTLSRAEAQRLSALGMNIVALWEWHSGDPAYFSYASGHADAIAAYRQAMGIGQPAGSAIYFAVDFNPRAQEIEPVRQYFRGVAAGLSAAGTGMARYKVGVYGSGAVCDAVKRDGLAQYSWLSNSTAWSGSLAYDGWNIRQGGRLAGLSFEHDSDRARAEYGGFRLAPAGAAGGGLRASESGAR